MPHDRPAYHRPLPRQAVPYPPLRLTAHHTTTTGVIMSDTRSAIYDEISAERDRQDAKFGEQNHPDGVDAHETSIMIADQWRDMVNQRLADGTVTWMDILFEEAYEATVEEDPAKLRAEVVQIAAVAVAWLECIDRRSAK